MRILIRNHTNVSNGHATATETPKATLRQSPITSPAQRNTPPISANAPNTTHCTGTGLLAQPTPDGESHTTGIGSGRPARKEQREQRDGVSGSGLVQASVLATILALCLRENL
jgi:hypothetical protein